MISEKLSNIFFIAPIATLIAAIKAARNGVDVRKIIAKTTSEFLPDLRERTPNILDRTLIVRAQR
jgi:hypothetical protein